MKALKAVLWLLVGLALGVGSLYWGGQGVAGVLSDRNLWERGPRRRACASEAG